MNLAVLALNNESDLLRKCDEYGLITVESVPEGITPMVINSVAELDNVLNYTASISNVDVPSSRITTTRTASVNFNIEANVVAHLSASLDLWTEGSFRQITGINYSRWSLTGTTTSYELKNSVTSHTLENGNAVIDGATDVDFYLYVDGLNKLYTSSLTAGFKYNPYDGMFDSYYNITN